MRYGLMLVMAGVLAYGLFMLLGWPAARWLEYTPHLQAEQISGDLRHGEARRLRINNNAPLERVSWQWRPAHVLRGRLTWQLMLSDQGQHLTGSVSLTGRRHLLVNALQGQLPLTTLAELAGRPLPFLTGQLLADMPVVRLNAVGLWQEIEGIVQLVDGQLPSGAPLGTLQAQFHTQGEMITAELRDTGGSMILDATLILNVDGRYQLRGELGTRANADPSLQQTLSLLGQPAPGGRRQFNLSGSVR